MMSRRNAMSETKIGNLFIIVFNERGKNEQY